MFLLLYPESREQLGRKRQVQEAAPGPGSPPPRPKDLAPFSMEPNPDPSASKSLCLSLDIIAFLPQVRWQQIDYPDDSIEGI